MNLINFLNEIDEITKRTSPEKLAKFVHELARTLPESERVDFIKRLKEVQSDFPEEKSVGRSKDATLQKIFDSYEEQLHQIENGELCMTGELNEEYDDWYCSDAEEFIYEDPDGVLRIIESAAEFVHSCVENERYQFAYDLADILIGLEITVGGEYLDYASELMPIEDLSYYHLGMLDFPKLVIDGLHAAYCAETPEKRASELYRMLSNSREDGVTLEKVMQSGKELPGFQEFLKSWVAYLGRQTDALAQRLLKEALEFCNDKEQTLENARRFSKQHPALYEQYILNNLGKESSEKLYAIGEEALNAIDEKYIVRSRIALQMSRIALQMGKKTDAERDWLEAFRSETNVVNYLRMAVECEDFGKWETEAKQIYRNMLPQVGKSYGHVSAGELSENYADANSLYALTFFRKDFSYTATHGMSEKSALGWSSTFMKCGLALFLMLLQENNQLQSGMRAMCQKAVYGTGFYTDTYQNGMTVRSCQSSESLFWECFCKWKKTISLSAEDRAKYLRWVESLIEKRVRGIMEGNYRKYYGECAAYIAALGEVRESSGEAGGKQRVILRYKTAYSRRSAFVKELRAFG